MALLEMRGVSGEFDEPIYPTGTPRTITTSSGQTYNYDDVVNLILARYAEGKNPALAVKSALQLGFPEDVILTLPGVDAQAFEEGKRLIESGAFVEQATGTKADIQQAAPVGSAQYNARIAAGLDAFGFPPEEVARLTAQGLYGAGKQFDPGTQGLLATQPSTAPKAVVFGDSMSEYVGYKPDGTPDTKYGQSVADVIGANLGIKVENLATGGETSTEALAGGSKFGAFADYIATNKPEYAIIRYGAADAIKNKDPQATLDAVQQMVDIAKANGVTPIIVGVSELYGAQNSKTGNIAGYIDPGAEQRANAINNGLAQIAANNGVSFTDVRSAVSAGKGDLLDGVHSNADFGKKMADAISESIVSVIPEANVPKLPTNVDALSTTEKGQLYNSLVSQGYTDAQIRTAARAESDQDWNALKQIAADVKNTTPAQVERQVQSAAAPETGLLAQGTGMAQTSLVPADVKSQLDAFGPYNPNSEVWYYGGPQIVSNGKIYRKDPSGNIDITVAGGGPGSLQQVVSPTGELLLSTTDTGETSRLMAFAQNALPAAAAAALLGPAGAGLLSTPAAAAAGAGGTTLAKGGSVEDALKAAVLSGVAAYGLDYLLASPELLAARELASSGMSEEAIADTLISRGISPKVAIEAASNATGLPAAGANRGIGTVTPTGTAPLGGVIESTSLAGAGNLAGTVAPAAAATALPVLSAQTPGLLNQQVQVQSQTGGTQQAATTAIPGAGAGLLAQTQTVPVTSQTGATTQQTVAPVANLLTATAPTQTVPVSSQTATTTQQAAGPAGAMLGAAIAPTQTVPIETRTIPTQERAVTIPVVATESVTVPGKREPVPTATALIPAGAAGAAAGVTAPATPTSPFSATDAALAALLLGGAGSLLNQSQSGGFTMDQGLANAIINAPRPTYRGGVGGYQMPGMFQIAPTNVYNPFATTAPFGTGRFGGFSAPITLPRGLV